MSVSPKHNSSSQVTSSLVSVDSKLTSTQSSSESKPETALSDKFSQEELEKIIIGGYNSFLATTGITHEEFKYERDLNEALEEIHGAVDDSELMAIAQKAMFSDDELIFQVFFVAVYPCTRPRNARWKHPPFPIILLALMKS